jgi:hypothetical protein
MAAPVMPSRVPRRERSAGELVPPLGPGEERTNDRRRHALGQLDLIYDPQNGVDVSDEYGARWAAIQGNTPILPDDCPA